MLKQVANTTILDPVSNKMPLYDYLSREMLHEKGP